MVKKVLGLVSLSLWLVALVLYLAGNQHTTLLALLSIGCFIARESVTDYMPNKEPKVETKPIESGGIEKK